MHLKKIIAAFFHILLFTYFSFAETPGDFDFEWTFIRSEDSIIDRIDISEIPGEMLENELVFYFKPHKMVYLYLLLSGPVYVYKTLFPDSFDIFKRKGYLSGEQRIPGDGDFLRFIEKRGEYNIHFLVSKERLDSLENLIEKYNKIKMVEDSYAGMEAVHKEIGAEIARLKRDAKFSNNNTKSHSPMMGTFLNTGREPQSLEGFDWVVEKEITDYVEKVRLDRIFFRRYKFVHE